MDPVLRMGVEMEGLKEYLDRCCFEFVHDPHAQQLILCGGKTNSSSPFAEAESMIPYVSQAIVRFGGQPNDRRIVTVNTGTNASQNVRDAFRTMQSLQPIPTRIIIACDTLRTAKVQIIADRLRTHGEFTSLFGPKGNNVDVLVRGYPRRDIHPRSTWPRQLTEAILFAVRPSLIDRDLNVTDR